MPYSESNLSTHRESFKIEKLHCASKLLLERFPHNREVILRLLESDGTFQQLVEEYEACSDAVDRLDHLHSDHDLHNDYVEVLSQVESEVISYIAVSGRAFKRP